LLPLFPKRREIMAIGPDGQESMHVGMASPPHIASSRARMSASTMNHPMRLRSRGARLIWEGEANPTLRARPILVTVLRKRPAELFNLSLDLLLSHPGTPVSYRQHRSNEQYGGHPATYRHSGESHRKGLMGSNCPPQHTLARFGQRHPSWIRPSDGSPRSCRKSDAQLQVITR
jgi:hypothetical protein